MKLVQLEKLSNSQGAMTAAYRAGMPLQEVGWMRHPAASWNNPAIVAFEGDTCIGGVNYSEDLDDLVMIIKFAWCTDPKALAAVLLRFRQVMRTSKCAEMAFTCHDGNAEMAKAVKVLGLEPHSHTYVMPISRPSQTQEVAS